MASLDELDSALFGKGFDVKDSKATETKKKVMFKDFGANDPLGDLNLSDEDDEEFDESLKDEPTKLAKDQKIANLFGVRTSVKEEIDDTTIKRTPSFSNKSSEPSKPPVGLYSELKASDFLGEPSSSPPPAPALTLPSKSTATKMKQLFDDNDDDDIIANLTDKPRGSSSSNSQTKKSMLIEDLFGSRPKSSSGTTTTSDSNAKKSSLNLDAFNIGESVAGYGNDATSKAPTATGGFSLSAPKEAPRRGRRASAVLNDPLGLLSASTLQLDDPPKPEPKQQQQQQQAPIDLPPKSDISTDLPEWLGGPRVPKDQRQDLDKIRSDESMKKSSTDLTSTIAVESADQSALASKLLGMEFEQQAAMMNLHRQEHELRTAASLAQQSEKLNYLLEKQKTKLGEQDKQFNALITRQLERQAMLEAQMKAQQDRIDGYIRTLAAQPGNVAGMIVAVDEKKTEAKEEVEDEGLVQKLQLEKLYLENTLDCLREKHEKEMAIVEDSYKKQVAFLEEAMVQMEKRMQDDVESIEADYKAKIQKLKDELVDCHNVHMDEKEMLKNENSKLLEDIREQHSRSMQVLQREHLEAIERITKSKESERHAIEIMRSEGTSVQNVLNKSQVIIESLEDLQKRFEGRDTGFAASQTSHLAIQEKNIEYLKEVLEKQKNEFTEEKQKLMDTVRNLESNIAELTREFKNQSANFKEGEDILKSREQALLRDREIFVEQTTWERERLQAMRETWAKEQDMQLEWMAQERQALAAEKGKMQIVNRLKVGRDESSKVELEATIRAAQEAASSANQERLRWQEKINELETQRKALQEKESHLVQKAKELQDFTQSAINKRDEGMRALKEARFIEERYKEKLSQLQLQQEILTQRESQLASEKLELARERLALRVSEDNKPVKDTDAKNVRRERKDSLSDGSGRCSPCYKDIVDPQLVLLKWELDNRPEFALPSKSSRL